MNIPINNEVNENADRVLVPCESREMLDELESGKNDGSPAKSKEGLAGDEIDKSTEYDKESMHNLNHLAQVCCDKEGLNYENLSFSRRVTRSMHNLRSAPGYRSDQQTSKSTTTEPTVVNIEDDISMSVPNTVDIGNSSTAQGSDVKSGEVEGNRPELNVKHC